MDFNLLSPFLDLDTEMPFIPYIKQEGGSSKRQRVETVSKKKGYKKAGTVYQKMKKSQFKRDVRAVLSAMAETKKAFHTSGNSLVMFNSGIDSTGDIMQLMPAIYPGATDGQRVGDQIRARSMNVRGYVKLNINSTSAIDNSTKLPTVICRLMVVSMKNKASFPDASASAAPLATLLQKGTTTVGFTGLLSDIYAPINTEAFTIHHDENFYLSQDFVGTYGASAPSSRETIDVKNTVKFFNVNVKCFNRVLRYDEDTGSGIYPTNFSPILLLGYAYLDGSAADTLSTNVGLQYDSRFTYEDA